jgi:TolA-binding protein
MFVRWRAFRCRLVPAVMGSCLSIAAALPATGQLAPPSPTPADSSATPSADTRAVEIYRSATALQDRGLYDLAAAQWGSLARRFPTSPLAGQAHHFRGLCLFQLQRYDQAQLEFQRVISDWPRLEPDLLEQSYVNLGLAQFNLGQAAGDDARDKSLDAAVSTFSTQLERFPNGKHAPKAWFYRAEARYAQGKLNLAIRAYRTFVERYPNHPLRARTLYGLGVAQQESGKPAEAAKSFERFLSEFSPTPPLPPGEGRGEGASLLAADTHLRYGETLVALGRTADAEPHFAAAAAAKGFADADEAMERQAACRFEAEDYTAAAKLYAELTTRFADSPLVSESTVAAGKCYYLSGDFSQAARWLRRGRQLAGDDPKLSAEAAHWLVQALMHDGQAAAAFETAEQAINAIPQPPPEMLVQLRLDRADALYELDDRRADSVAAYADIAREFSNDPLAPQAAYMAAYAAVEIGDPKSALAYATAFRKAYPDNDLTADVRHVAAEASLLLGDYARAARDFERLLADLPKHEAADRWSVRRALCLSLGAQHDDVIRSLDPQWRQFSEPAIQAEAGLLLGQSLLATGKPERAARVLKTAAALPRWEQADQVLLTLARAERASGNTTDAIATLDRLINEFPDSPLMDRAYYQRGELHAAAGDHASAIHDFSQVPARWDGSPLVPHALLNQARQEYRQQQLAPAQATLTRLLARFSHHDVAAQAYLTRATVRYETGNYAGSIADVRALLQLKPSRNEQSDAIYLRGLCEARLHTPADAVASFEAILRDDPQYGSTDRALYELAWAYDDAAQPDRAIAAYSRLSQEHPNSPLAAEAWYRVGRSQYDRGDFADAAKNFQAAQAHADDDALREKAAHKLAWAEFSQHKFREAEQAFSKQLAESPAGPLAGDGAIMLAESRFARDDYAGALKAYTAALAGPPARDDLLALGLLHAGQAAAQLEKWDQSLALLDQCRKDFPKCASTDQVRYERGWALYHLDKYDEARQEFEAAAGNDTDVLAARARFMIGEIQFAKKQYEDAVRTFFQVAYGFPDADAPGAIRTWQAEATFEAARCLEQMQRFEAARKLYAELLKRFPESSKAAHARNSLAAIKTR